jgi:hypothetical protein
MADRLDSSGQAGPAELVSGQELVSGNKAYALVAQSDGNVVGYDMTQSDRPPFWASAEGAKTFRDRFRFIMQRDGNAVMYNARGIAVWATGTDVGADRGPFQLIMQSDRNVVLRDKAGEPLWASDSDTSDAVVGTERYYIRDTKPAKNPRKATTVDKAPKPYTQEDHCTAAATTAADKSSWAKHVWEDPWWQLGAATVGGIVGTVSAHQITDNQWVRGTAAAGGAVGGSYLEFLLGKGWRDAKRIALRPTTEDYENSWFTGLLYKTQVEDQQCNEVNEVLKKKRKKQK